ncbi:MAG: transcription termination/antitermination factor NusG [Clostridia bacterium]|jgi:transcriptional antiterminator NusG|nr:transcription termination/antitermination factor NusG [Clostridia bacterium]
MAEVAKWYVIHTNTGYEAMVKNTLEKLIENSNLQEQILEIKIPMEQTIEEKANGKKKVVLRKILPCYVFIKLVYSNELWYLITNTRGVTGFVGPQGKAVPLTDEEVKRMRLDTWVEEVDFVKGDSVQIVAGPLDGFVGEVLDLNDTAQKAKVRVAMFDTETEVEVEYVQLKKVN